MLARWRSQDQVRDSLEGWVAGSSIPCDVANAQKLRERLWELPTAAGLPRGRLCRWDGGDGACGGSSGRERAVPHVKTYCRYDPTDRSVFWAVVASHNLSQAAWGKLEKGESQLYIKSYELGVLLTPSLLPAHQRDAGGGTASLWAPRAGGPPAPAGACVVPLPYSLPPVPYAAADIIWSTSDGNHLPHTQANARADRHGRVPGQGRSGGYYGEGAIGRALANATMRQHSDRLPAGAADGPLQQ